MSYPAQPPPPAPVPGPPAAPAVGPRRPVTAGLAAGLLAFMGLVGLAYAIATLAVVPGTLDRFRDSARGADGADVDGYVTLVWMFAALAAVLAVILFALYAALAVALRRGSNAARIGTWVACGLGLAFGCGSTAAVAGQRSGDGDPTALGVLLSGSYPESWIGLNLTLAIAQMVGYLVIAGLLIAAPGAFFGRAGNAAPAMSVPATSAFGGLPTLGGPPAGAPHAYAPPTDGAYPPYPGAAGGHSPYPPGPYPPAAAAPSAWAHPGGPPPDGPPTSPPATGNPPPPAPDDEYWARPSS